MTDTADLPARMTVQEKVSLLSGDGPWGLGGVPRLGLPPIVLTDGPHGVRLMADTDQALDLDHAVPATCFPTAAGLGATWDPDLLEEVGRALGREAREIGVEVLLGPGMNLKRHPRGGRNFEYLSEDPLVSGILAGAMVRGIQSTGVAACLKHYAVNNQESHRMVVDAVVDPRTLHQLYLSGFEIAVAESAPWTVMCAYNLVNGTYASQHRWLLTDVLRDRFGFDGLAMTDWGATDDRLEGIRAGLDLEMPGGAGAHDERITRALETGELAMGDLDACVGRVVQLINRVRPTGSTAPTGDGGLSAQTTVDHHALARRVASATAVLLKNDGALLPLGTGQSVALIGPFADAPRFQGSGSSLVTPTQVDRLTEALGERITDLRHDDGRRIDRAAEVAAAADVAVVTVGLPEEDESEGFDRENLDLPSGHDALVRAVVAANPRTVVVLTSGSPVLLPWADSVPAIVLGYLAGQAGAGGMADVLTGHAEPGGRLAETFVADDHDVPASANFPGDPRQVEHREGLMVGYRAAATLDRLPVFAFGHGLSYTRIELSDPSLSTPVVPLAHLTDGQAVTVTLTATNTGARHGSQVVQAYVHRPRSGIPRPHIELGAFAKVRLEPGESAQVTLRLGRRAFRHHDGDGWQVEEGPAEIRVGTSSADLPHRLALQIGSGEGTAPVPPPPAVMDDARFEAALGRTIPVPRAVDRFTRNSTIGDLRQTRVGRRMHKSLMRAIVARSAPDASPATRKAVERGAQELPLRGLVLFSGGKLTFDHLAAMLDALDGRWGSAARRALRAVVRAMGSGGP
ncbi:glycoside hydrolase family 3 C-terminal domain-containing protein [soil metagenome]